MQGGCQCGAVRYNLYGALPPAYACHCGECKKQTASAFSLSLFIAFDRLDVEGELRCYSCFSFSGAVKECFFCPQCGTRMWHRSSASPDKITLKVGTLDDSAGIAPQAHLWVSKKQQGITLDPNTVQFEMQPEDFKRWRDALA